MLQYKLHFLLNYNATTWDKRWKQTVEVHNNVSTKILKPLKSNEVLKYTIGQTLKQLIKGKGQSRLLT